MKDARSAPTVADLSEIGYDDFRFPASDMQLTRHEKIGFPDTYRDGFEEAIFADIKAKLRALFSEFPAPETKESKARPR